MSEVNIFRRKFMIQSGTLACAMAIPAVASVSSASKKAIAKLSDIKLNEPILFSYPEDESAYLLDLGKFVENGAGPKRSIVAYSGLCQHMGCVVTFDEKSGHLVCPCHASAFDPSKNGDALVGPTTTGLPAIRLSIEGDTVYALGVENGLVYGRSSNDVK